MNALSRRNGFLPSSSFFDDFLTKDLFGWPGLTNEGSSVPRLNVREDNDGFQVELAAPGLKKDDFHIELDNDMLTISSERTNTSEENETAYTRREFSYMSFKRSLYLPNTVEIDKIKANYRDGILHLTIPKKEEARKKPIKRIAIS